MSDRLLVEFNGQDADFECQELGDGIMIRLRYEACQITVAIDYDSAWRLSDALARVTSRASVSRQKAAREATS